MPQRDRQKQALTRLQRRIDWLTQKVSQDSDKTVETVTTSGEAVYGVSSRFRGIPKQGDLVFSRIMRHDFRVKSLILQVDEPPSQQVDFDVLSGGTTQASLLLPSGNFRLNKTLGGFRVAKSTSLQVQCRTDTVDVRNAEVSFDLIRA
jgi:hypothetical protein